MNNEHEPGNATDPGLHDKSSVDWDAVELDYRAGVMSDRALGLKHGISHTAIQKRAKKLGWEKDLYARIRQKADAKVAKSAVSSEVASKRAATELQVIEANARAIAGVICEHRRLLSLARGLLSDLLAGLEPQLTPADCASDPTPSHRAKSSMHGSLQERAGILKQAAETMKTLIALERQAFKVDEEAPVQPATANTAENMVKEVPPGVDEALQCLMRKLGLPKATT